MRVNIIRQVRKRSGQLVPFNQEKIANAIFKAAQAVGGEDRQMADELADVVTMFLEKQYGPRTAASPAPTIEEIQDMVEKVLIETGHAKTAKAYILYRERRARIRETVKVRKQIAGRNNPTDLSLLVDPATRDEIRAVEQGADRAGAREGGGRARRRSPRRSPPPSRAASSPAA